MSTLYFLPWCRLQDTTSVGGLTLFSVRRDVKPESMVAAQFESILKILSHFHGLDEHPVGEFSVAACMTRGVLADLAEEEAATLQEFVALVCFSALSVRDFESEHGRWSNSDCFRLHACGPWSGSLSPDNAFRIHRGDGVSVLQAGFPVKYHEPPHAAPIDNVQVSEKLLRSLWSYRQQAQNGEWQKWREAIVTFNRANSDGQDISWRVDWVLRCSAFQRILGKPTKALQEKKQTVEEFRKHISEPAKRLCMDETVLCDWLGEFCALRGDFAHGKRHPNQPRQWQKEQTHLSAAAIAFPVLVRFLLAQQKLYTTTIDDYASLAALCLFLEEHRGLSHGSKPWYDIFLEQRLDVAIKLGLQEAGSN